VQILPPVTAETITVEGVFLYSDGKPVIGEWVSFKSAKTAPAAGDDDDDEDARGETDSKGRFTVKVLKGARGAVSGAMYTFVGEFENCAQLERLIKQSGSDFAELKTPAVEIITETNQSGIVLKYSFPSCKKAKIE
jgi:hypothetical protein